MQLEEQKRLNSSLEQENKSIMNQSVIQLETESEEKERLKERLNFAEIAKQELQNQMAA